MTIPYTTEKRTDSGLTNPALGLWLFLASEVMLFASLFSAYALLRIGASQWPKGTDRLHPGLGAVNTLVLLAATVCLMAAARRLGESSARRPAARRFLFGAIALTVTFSLIKLAEYHRVIEAGFIPSTDVYTAIYFALTGIHLLHLLGGLVVVGYLAGPGFGDIETRPNVIRQRVELLVRYWYFVDVVWVLLFVALYLS